MTTVETTPADDTGPASIAYLPLLARLQGEFLAGIAGADLAAPVPACGRWNVRNLVEHLARIHHWAAAEARRTTETPLGRGPFDLETLYADCARELLDTLTELGPQADASTMVGRGPASFWHRRQVHETLVHLHDLRAAAAGTAALGLADAEPQVWADGVDEIVTMFQPRQVRLGRMEPLRFPVLLLADDVPGARSWVLGFPEPDRAREVAPDVIVSGTAEALTLVLWRRLTPEEAGLTVQGDRQDLDAALAERLTP